MPPLKLDGSFVACSMTDKLIPKIKDFIRFSIYAHEEMTSPRLVTILIGDNSASKKYIRMKTSIGKSLGMGVSNINFPESVSYQEVVDRISGLNRVKSIHGIIVQHPVPERLRSLEQMIVDTISPAKDVDGLTSFSFGTLALKNIGFKPATPSGILTLLDYYKIDIEGCHVVIVGGSNILGKPLSLMLLNKNATVTMCNKFTRNLNEHVRNADIVVGAAGVPNLIKADWVKKDSILIDAGCNPGNIGDIEKEAYRRSLYYTPIPGGVGPVTIAVLLTQTVQAARRTMCEK